MPTIHRKHPQARRASTGPGDQSPSDRWSVHGNPGMVAVQPGDDPTEHQACTGGSARADGFAASVRRRSGLFIAVGGLVAVKSVPLINARAASSHCIGSDIDGEASTCASNCFTPATYIITVMPAIPQSPGIRVLHEPGTKRYRFGYGAGRNGLIVRRAIYLSFTLVHRGSLGVANDPHTGDDNCVMRYDDAHGYYSKAVPATVRYYPRKENAVGMGICIPFVASAERSAHLPVPVQEMLVSAKYRSDSERRRCAPAR